MSINVLSSIATKLKVRVAYVNWANSFCIRLVHAPSYGFEQTLYAEYVDNIFHVRKLEQDLINEITNLRSFTEPSRRLIQTR